VPASDDFVFNLTRYPLPRCVAQSREYWNELSGSHQNLLQQTHKIDVRLKKSKISLDIICAREVKSPTNVNVNGDLPIIQARYRPTVCLWWGSVSADLGVLAR
jgi:hypothetical protein